MDIENPKVTIAIPTFNRGEILPKAVESSLDQTYKNIEIIISNNCSTDNTNLVINSYRNYKNIKIFSHKQNIGMKANWQFCLDNASGKLFILLSDDDYFSSKEAISKFVNEFRGSNYKCVVFSDVLIKRGTDSIKSEQRQIIIDNQNYKQILIEYFNGNISIFPCATMYLTKDIQSVGGYIKNELILAVDAFVLLSVLKTNRKVIRIPENLCIYYAHESLSSSQIEIWDSDLSKLYTLSKNLFSNNPEIARSILNSYKRIPIGYLIRLYRSKGLKSFPALLKILFKHYNRIFDFDVLKFVFKKILIKLF